MAERGRAALAFVLWGAITACAAAGAGCFRQGECEGGEATYGSLPNQGRLIDADTWESTPVDEDWLDFPHQQLWRFDLQALGLDRKPDIVHAYVSAEKNPYREAGNFTTGAGNIVELSDATRGRLAVKNGTCADYYLRIIVKATPRPPVDPDAGELDGGDAGDTANDGDGGDGNAATTEAGIP